MENRAAFEQTLQVIYELAKHYYITRKGESIPFLEGDDGFRNLVRLVEHEARRHGYQGVMVVSGRQDRLSKSRLWLVTLLELVGEGRDVTYLEPEREPLLFWVEDGLLPNIKKAQKAGFEESILSEPTESLATQAIKVAEGERLGKTYPRVLGGGMLNLVTALQVIEKPSTGGILWDDYKGFDLKRSELYEEREWRKMSGDKQMNKDRHWNPDRVHANCHSSKVNNRERSKKKRQSLKRHKNKRR